MTDLELHVRALVFPSECGAASKVVVEVWPLPVDDALHNAVAAAMVAAAQEVLTLAKIIAGDDRPLH